MLVTHLQSINKYTYIVCSTTVPVVLSNWLRQDCQRVCTAW